MKKISNHKHQLIMKNPQLSEEMPHLKHMPLNEYRKLYEESISTGANIIELLRNYFTANKLLGKNERLYVMLNGKKLACRNCKYHIQKFDVAYSVRKKTYCIECAFEFSLITNEHLRELFLEFLRG